MPDKAQAPHLGDRQKKTRGRLVIGGRPPTRSFSSIIPQTGGQLPGVSAAAPAVVLSPAPVPLTLEPPPPPVTGAGLLLQPRLRPLHRTTANNPNRTKRI
jgi:hypothetical protein